MKRKIYVASSWRNEYYPDVVVKLREAGHAVYDFRNPPSGAPGFKWSCVSEDYMDWTPEQYRDNLRHPKAERQFYNDIKWRLVILAYWSCPAAEVLIQRQAGLLAKDGLLSPTFLNGRNRN